MNRLHASRYGASFFRFANRPCVIRGFTLQYGLKKPWSIAVQIEPVRKRALILRLHCGKAVAVDLAVDIKGIDISHAADVVKYGLYAVIDILCFDVILA